MNEYLLSGRVKEMRISRTGRVTFMLKESTFLHSRLTLAQTKVDPKKPKKREPQNKIYRFKVHDINLFLQTIEEVQASAGKTRQEFIPIGYTFNILTPGESSLLFSLFTIGIFLLMVRRSGASTREILNLGSNKVEIVKNTGVTFKDVAGIDEAKQEIMEFIDFLKNGEKYDRKSYRHQPQKQGKKSDFSAHINLHLLSLSSPKIINVILCPKELHKLFLLIYSILWKLSFEHFSICRLSTFLSN